MKNTGMAWIDEIFYYQNLLLRWCGYSEDESRHRSLSECKLTIFVTKPPCESDSLSSSDCIKSQSNFTELDCWFYFFFSETKLASLTLYLLLCLLSMLFFHLCFLLWSFHGFLTLLELSLSFNLLQVFNSWTSWCFSQTISWFVPLVHSFSKLIWLFFDKVNDLVDVVEIIATLECMDYI